MMVSWNLLNRAHIGRVLEGSQERESDLVGGYFAWMSDSAYRRLYSVGMGFRCGLSCSSASMEDIVWCAIRGSMWILPMYRISLSVGSGRSCVFGLNCGFSALVLQRTSGS